MLQEKVGKHIGSKRRLRKLSQVGLIGIGLIVCVLIAAHFVWKYSGSDQWRPVLDKNGVKIYALKTPGVALERFRAVTRLHTTLHRIVAGMTDTSTEACNDFVPGCKSGQVLARWTPQSLYSIQYFQVKYPPPFQPRDLIVRTVFSRDAGTNALSVICTALPNALPRDEHYIRVTDMYNTWRYTPLENGEIEVEFVENYDPGIPYFLANRVAPISFYRLLRRLDTFFNKPKYGTTQFAFLSKT